MISANPMAMVAVLALMGGCVTDAGEVSEVPASDAVWEYIVDVQFVPGLSASELWRGRIDRSGMATVEIPRGGRDWLLIQVVQLGGSHLDRIAAAIAENDYWQLQGGLGMEFDMTDLPFFVLTVERGDGPHRVSYYGARYGFSEDVDRFLRVLDEIRRVIPDPNQRPDPPGAFGRVIRVEEDLIVIRLAEDSPALAQPGPSFAVYKNDTYKCDAIVVEIRGRVMFCKPRTRAEVDVGDSASIYLR